MKLEIVHTDPGPLTLGSLVTLAPDRKANKNPEAHSPALATRTHQVDERVRVHPGVLATRTQVDERVRVHPGVEPISTLFEARILPQKHFSSVSAQVSPLLCSSTKESSRIFQHSALPLEGWRKRTAHSAGSYSTEIHAA